MLSSCEFLIRPTNSISDEPGQKQIEIFEYDSDKKEAVANDDDGGANPKLVPLLSWLVLTIPLHIRWSGDKFSKSFSQIRVESICITIPVSQ